jgi:ppGpp synthetase/RelA/SpoT-type nucleotidyltranferase
VSTSPPAIDELFRRHLLEVDFWDAVAATVKRELLNIVQRARVPAKVEARAKTTGSVIGKAYRKPERFGQLEEFPDLAGARVLVPFTEDVDPVATAIHAHPELRVIQDETKKRSPDKLLYQARHLDVEVLGDLVPSRPSEFGTRAVTCEVQLQTFAQNLWANVSHQVTYKRDDLPDSVRGRVNRLIVLCELFDDEAAASRSEAFEHGCGRGHRRGAAALLLGADR